jgi:hypothetical protein
VRKPKHKDNTQPKGILKNKNTPGNYTTSSYVPLQYGGFGGQPPLSPVWSNSGKEREPVWTNQGQQQSRDAWEGVSPLYYPPTMDPKPRDRDRDRDREKERDRERERERERDRRRDSKDKHNKEKEKGKEKEKEKKKGWHVGGRELTAAGIGGAAVSLLTVLTEAAEGL